MYKIIITLKCFENFYIQKNYIYIKNLYNLIKKNFKYNSKILNTVVCLKKKNFVNIYSLPKKQKLFTVNKSPHIDKKSREQFFFSIYTKKIYINNLNMKQAIVFLFLIKNCTLYGNQIEICLFSNSDFCK